jgi:4'-phosphopantetheinyl transferase
MISIGAAFDPTVPQPYAGMAQAVNRDLTGRPPARATRADHQERPASTAGGMKEVVAVGRCAGPLGALGERDVHLWIVHLGPGTADEVRLSGLLSASERATVARLASPASRNRYARSHAAVRLILAHYLQCDPRAVRLGRDRLGKPRVRCSDLHYSMAHAPDVALVGVSPRGPLGVDVEAVRPLPEADALKRRCFTARERAHLEAVGTDGELMRLWVRKEAAAKVTGEGLRGVFDGLDVLTASAVPGLRILDLLPASGHVGAAAVCDDVARVVAATFSSWPLARPRVG